MGWRPSGPDSIVGGSQGLRVDAERPYRNAFARLLKPDPLRRVLMMGTDPRDLFVPVLRATLPRRVPPGGQLLDLRAGDGQTFALVADAVPAGTTVSFEEPNAHSVADYRAMLGRIPHLKPGTVLAGGFDEIAAAAPRTGSALSADGRIHLALALQMIFFLAAIAERRRLLAPPEGGSGGILGVSCERMPGSEFTLETVRQPSRLHGHSLSDLIALANITVLSQVEGLSKSDAACRLLRDTPEAVDLRIEEDGPRKGMWSVLQPQLIAVLRRNRD